MDGSLLQLIPQIKKPFFNALGDEKVQQKLLTVMFDLLVESSSPILADAIGSAFKGVSARSFKLKAGSRHPNTLCMLVEKKREKNVLLKQLTI